MRGAERVWLDRIRERLAVGSLRSAEGSAKKANAGGE
jgi:hypothetical protein